MFVTTKPRLVFVSLCVIVVNSASSEDPKPLFLSPLIARGLIQEAQNLSTTALGNVTSYTGYLTVNQDCGSHLFFWFFPAEDGWEEAPVVLWLDGVPGVTSLMRLFEEFGPWRITKDNSSLTPNQYSWTKKLNVIFVDQPVGAGFSFTEQGCYANNSTEVAQDMYSALTQFFTLFPNLKMNKFFLMGDYLTGQYIPAIAEEIDHSNDNSVVKINLVGLVVRNPMIDMRCMYGGDFLYELGIIDKKAKNVIKQKFNELLEAINEKKYKKAVSIQLYDIKKYKIPHYLNVLYTDENLFDRDMPFIKFVSNIKTRRELHVGTKPFKLKTFIANENLITASYAEHMTSTIEKLLKTNKYVIGFYVGQFDLLCPYSSLQCVLNSLQWPGADKYQEADRSPWYVSGRLAGWFKRQGNLFEVVVRNSGHMTAYDQPEAVLDLITAVVADTPGTELLTNLKTHLW